MLKTAEAVSIGHPDKTADYISSYILDRLIEQDPGIHYAVEVMIKDNCVMLGGEVKGSVDMSDIETYVCDALREIGYDEHYSDIWKNYAIDVRHIEVINKIGVQSADINQGVEHDGWGDQGVFVGYACKGPALINRELWLARKLNDALYEHAKTSSIRFLKNLSKIDEFRSIIDLTHFTFIELHGGGNIDLWIKANYLSGTNIKCLYFRDRDTSTTPPSVVHPQKVIITSKREIENYIPISSIEEKFDVTFTPYEIEHWNDMDVANSLYNKGIRFGNDQKHSENVIKQILQGQNIWNQIILSPENRSEIQDWFQQMKDFFEDAGW